jgi:hypothetical protein
MRISPSAAPVIQKYISYNHHSVHVAAFHLLELTEAVTCAVIA